MVEQVTGRLNYGGAALNGAGSGALFGAVIGWIFGLFSLLSPLVASVVPAFYGLITDDEVADEAARLLGDAPTELSRDQAPTVR